MRSSSSALPMTPARGVRRSWEASARNWRMLSSARCASVSADSRASSIPSKATAVRPSSVRGLLGRRRRPRVPSRMRSARAVIRSSGPNAVSTTRISSSPVSSTVAVPAASSMPRRVLKVSLTPAWLACRARVPPWMGSCTASWSPLRCTGIVGPVGGGGLCPPLPGGDGSVGLSRPMRVCCPVVKRAVMPCPASWSTKVCAGRFWVVRT